MNFTPQQKQYLHDLINSLSYKVTSYKEAVDTEVLMEKLGLIKTIKLKKVSNA